MPNELLHIEMMPNNEINVKAKGQQDDVCNMIENVMNNRKDVAAVLITSVVQWADNNKILHHRLGQMVKNREW